MSKLERDLEERCRLLAEQHDGKLLKFKPPQKGWHDRLLLLPGYMALVEFKRAKKAAVQPLQNNRQAWCTARAIPAFRVWDYAQFVEIVRVRPSYANERDQLVKRLGTFTPDYPR